MNLGWAGCSSCPLWGCCSSRHPRSAPTPPGRPARCSRRRTPNPTIPPCRRATRRRSGCWTMRPGPSSTTVGRSTGRSVQLTGFITPASDGQPMLARIDPGLLCRRRPPHQGRTDRQRAERCLRRHLGQDRRKLCEQAGPGSGEQGARTVPRRRDLAGDHRPRTAVRIGDARCPRNRRRHGPPRRCPEVTTRRRRRSNAPPAREGVALRWGRLLAPPADQTRSVAVMAWC